MIHWQAHSHERMQMLEGESANQLMNNVLAWAINHGWQYETTAILHTPHCRNCVYIEMQQTEKSPDLSHKRMDVTIHTSE